MKTTILTAAIALMALTATTASADRLMRDNVVCSTGSVWGFTVHGAEGLTHYVQERDLGRCPEGTIGVPASVDVFKPQPVIEWLATQGVVIETLHLKAANEDVRFETTLDDEGNEVVTRIRTTQRLINGGW